MSWPTLPDAPLRKLASPSNRPLILMLLRGVIAASALALCLAVWRQRSEPAALAGRQILRTAAITPRAKSLPREAAEPGLAVSFRAPGENSPLLDSRVDRLPAIYVPQGTAPSVFVAPGAFAAMAEGYISVRLRDTCTFSAAGRGRLKVTINGETAIEAGGDDFSAAPSRPVQLNKGNNHLVVYYQSPPQGDAFYRLYWSTSDFPAEPVPPGVLSHNPALQGLAPAMRLREGRFLFAQFRCANCHALTTQMQEQVAAMRSAPASPEHPSLAPQAMPELACDAPSLAGLGSRLNTTWLACWISNPRSLNPEAQMPQVFHEAQAAGDAPVIDARAADIAAYLATLSLKPPLAQRPAATDDAAAAGGRLFAHLRCVACHTLPEADGFDLENHRIPLSYVKAKYKPAALWAFLKNPQAHFAWIGMPNFRLSDLEADRLCAFLLSRQGKSLDWPGDGPRGDARRGEALVASAGCLNCHLIDAASPASTLKAAALAQIPTHNPSGGCLAQSPPAGAPDFHLSDEQRQALAEFLAADRSSLSRDNLAEFARRQVSAMRCTSCHTRDTQDDLYTQVENEVAPLVQDGAEDEPQGEGDEKVAPDQTLPMLTWAGEKLHPAWTANLLLGRQSDRLRPWLRARMPAFAARAVGIAYGLPLEHGFDPMAVDTRAPDAQLAKIGRTLAGREGGFSCISCHGAGAMKPVGVFDAPGINFKYINERITHHYYTRWVYNPLRIHRETKMPTFADSAGQTSLKETLGGDARRQYEAIWNYLQAGRAIQPPEN